ncbi:tRNA (N(6)-L-threonylcarbamoyladenosine(37)-C(2))-methylthiotransferase [Methanocella conradii]|uniref:tRNA (N(6)-L-threonylcarbamoyladenosine(37)-C(2))- methylthiotransferase n=1 Tax=Methanocella conradii TaxID=1175444 RepID=UPI0024B3C29E|nr:tRNA (N(6)-L-threonylcarbamoyladenosine(37)-C(2))-methylthiotransferase [Methanocella conradii]MDI6897504.1 tRNA (N(6)-L-threonylcarbamoyladenosine(37)-C(2))-methylthiotransferase [Methanocella conradii]
MKVYIETYGCTANMGDSHRMRSSIQAAGCCVAERPDEADVIIINTCAVTEPTSRGMLKAIKKYEDKRVIVAGCMAAAQPYLLEGLGGNVESAGAPGAEAAMKLLGIRPVHGKPLLKGKTAIISIAEGCVGKCTYCIVRLARGPLRSAPPASIKKSVKDALEMGAKEIFLTAQDTGAYGMDTGIRLPKLMHDILDIEGDYRVRLGMMNPFSIADILDDVIRIFQDPHVYKFAHIPIQSGSDRILRLMGRPYTESQYSDMVRRLRECIPDITLSTDYIVGFPEETDGDFEMTMEDLRANKPLKVNITRFSPRPGTVAAKMDDLPMAIKKERSRALTRLHHEITSAYMRSSIGRRLSVLVTEEGKPGSSVARDDSYHMVVIPAALPPGARLDVKICGASTTYMIGKPIEI